MPDVFEAKYVSNALRYLIDQSKIPILLMVTVSNCDTGAYMHEADYIPCHLDDPNRFCI